MTEDEQIEYTANLVGALLLRVHADTGAPIEAILAGAHAQVATMMVASLGGEETAELLENAAEQVRDLPALGASRLAFLAPAGRA